MKKIILIAAIALLSCTPILNAKKPVSVKHWTEDFIKGDPMKGSQDKYRYTCLADNAFATFSYTSTNRKSFSVCADKSVIFDFKYLLEVDEWRAPGKVGLYDSEGNLIKIIECPFKQSKGYSYQGWSRCSEEECKEILDFIENNEGYVRIIVTTYASKDLDMNIPCKHSDK
jgi:hypothetical protein